MFESILVPLDGSDLSDLILAAIRPLLGEGVRVELVTLVPDGGDEEQLLRLDEARRHLVALSETFPDGVEVGYRVQVGEAKDGILEQIQELEPALVAMATHGRSGVARLVRGSVAEHVLRRCPCPLLLWNPFDGKEPQELRETELRRIVVPLDGSPRASAILGTVERLARACSSEVVLLKVGRAGATVLLAPEAAQAATLRELEESLEPFRVRLSEAGVRCRARSALGDEPARILDVAREEQADLVAMATHGFTGLDRWLFGSIAEEVLRACHVPMLIERNVPLTPSATTRAP